MQNVLKLALIQSDLAWEDPAQNRINFEQQIHSISASVDLIVLPEMFSSGFTMNASAVAESMSGTTMSWLKHIAQKRNSAIAGSLVIEDRGIYYNRLIFIEPNGDIHSYNKRHTFTLAGEHEVYSAGDKKLIINYKGWKLCPLICYDLRFPVWARNAEDYDALIYVANWPKVRIDAWDTLLKARAIENMSYCIGVNRIGLDGNRYEYPGHSAAYDVLGQRIDNIPVNKQFVDIITLDQSHIEHYRKKLGFLNDRDTFSLTM